MLKFYVLFFLLIFFKCADAHNPQVSTISILQDQNNKWAVFITAPLYTFQLALKVNDPTLEIEKLDPTAMQHKISKLLKGSLILNDDLGLALRDEKIQLAHEITIYYSLSTTDTNFVLNTLSFRAFDKLRDHFTLLKIVPYQTAGINFILNTDNNFAYANNENKIITSGRMLFYVLLTLSMLIILGLFYFLFKEKSRVAFKSELPK